MRDFDSLSTEDQSLALAAALEAITAKGLRSIQELAAAAGKSPQQTWEAILVGTCLMPCALPSRLHLR